MSISAVVFDMDDTLFRERDFVISGFRAVDHWLRTEHQVEGFFKVAFTLFTEGQKELVFNTTLEQLKIPYDEDFIKSLVHIYRHHEPNIILHEDAEWALNHLKESIKLGLISDGFFYTQTNKVNALNIRSRFHSIVLSDKFGKDCWKPSPVPYEQSIKELVCSHNECVYIGDNLNKDFVTAKSLGWLTIHINRLDGIYKDSQVSDQYCAHYQIDDLRELRDIPELHNMFID